MFTDVKTRLWSMDETIRNERVKRKRERNRVSERERCLEWGE